MEKCSTFSVGGIDQVSTTSHGPQHATVATGSAQQPPMGGYLVPDIEAAIRDFLAQVDPETGYIG
jgi:hypothetical protein